MTDNYAKHWYLSFPDKDSYNQFKNNQDLISKFKNIKDPILDNGIIKVEADYTKRIWKSTLDGFLEDYGGIASISYLKNSVKELE